MWLQLIEPHLSIHWHAIIQDMQIRLVEINNSLTGSVLDVRIPDVPLPGNGPIQNLRA